MRHMTAPGAPGRCQRCLLLSAYCICELVGAAETSEPQVVIVRHQWEAFKSSGTARLAALALGNLRIIDMAFENPEPVRQALSELEDAWLLYPGGPATGAAGNTAADGDERTTQSDARRPTTLVVLDGTWKQTRKMLRRLPELAHMPRFSLAPTADGDERDRLREAPRPGARSTLESIAEALGELDSPERGRRLLELHAAFVTRTRTARGQKPQAS
jgi:DTW domain-containing protein YfiP